MAERITELRGQDFNGGVPVKRYIYRDFATSLDVDASIQSFADIDLTYGGLPVDLSGRTIQELGNRQWYVTIPYKSNAGSIILPGAGTASQPASQHGGDSGRDEPVLYDIDYTVSGSTVHITQSVETLQSVATGTDTPRSFGRAIGVNPITKEIAGCDVVTGDVSFTRYVQIPATAFTGRYASNLERLLKDPEHRRACVNDAPFFGYEAGEVLIRSASIGTVDGSGYRPGRFEFAVSRNQALVTISDDPLLQLVDVKGWSYIWVTYRQGEQVVGAANRPDMQPFEAYEEKVYPDGDFSVLGVEEYQVSAS